jgi:hypothetical protein
VHIFPRRNFAAAMLLHISIFHLDILTTRRLIYYPAMTKTWDAEMHMGAVAIHYCGWLFNVHIFPRPPQQYSSIFQYFTLIFVWQHVDWYNIEWWSKYKGIRRGGWNYPFKSVDCVILPLAPGALLQFTLSLLLSLYLYLLERAPGAPMCQSYVR